MNLSKQTLLLVLACSSVGLSCQEDTKNSDLVTRQNTLDSPVDEEEYPALDPATATFRQSEVDAFYADWMDGWDIVDTREIEDGQLVDYVTIETLYPDDPLAPLETPPPKPPLFNEYGEEMPSGLEQGEKWALTEFQTNPDLISPEGTIPVIRPNFDAYLEGRTPEHVQTISDYINLAPEPRPSGVYNSRLHVSYHEVSDPEGYISSSGNFTVYKYGDYSRNDMSLMQSGMFNLTRDESIEAGIQISSQIYTWGKSDPHFFVFSTAVGYDSKSKNYEKGYAHSVKGFVQYKDAPFPPGARFSTGYLSTVGGTQRVCNIKIQLFRGNWWIYGCTGWLGYYPTSASSSVRPRKRWYYDDLTHRADDMGFYGETYDDDPDLWMPFDMGTGNVVTTGVFGQDAYIRGIIKGLHNSHAIGIPRWTHFKEAGDAPEISNADCYSGTDVKTSSSANWKRHVYLGGPGRNENCM